MRFVWERLKIVIEPSCAVPVAPVYNGKLDVKGKTRRDHPHGGECRPRSPLRGPRREGGSLRDLGLGAALPSPIAPIRQGINPSPAAIVPRWAPPMTSFPVVAARKIPREHREPGEHSDRRLFRISARHPEATRKTLAARSAIEILVAESTQIKVHCNCQPRTAIPSPIARMR